MTLKSIALVVVTILLVVLSGSAMAMGGAEDEREFRWCDYYWWETWPYPQALWQEIMNRIAEAKGMCPTEVEARFGELFPGVDVWNMCLYEFHNFIRSLPRPPYRLVCLDEERQSPNVIAVFGTVPAFSTEQELREINHKLGTVMIEVLPVLRKLPRCQFPLGAMAIGGGAILISVESAQFLRAEEVYKIIAERAGSLFGIEDVPVIIGDAMYIRYYPLAEQSGQPQGSSSKPFLLWLDATVEPTVQSDTGCGEGYIR